MHFSSSKEGSHSKFISNFAFDLKDTTAQKSSYYSKVMHIILCYRDLFFPKLCWHIRLRPMSPPRSFQYTRENHIDTVFHTKRVEPISSHVLLTSNDIYEHIRDGTCFSKHHVPKHYQNTRAGELQAKMC